MSIRHINRVQVWEDFPTGKSTIFEGKGTFDVVDTEDPTTSADVSYVTVTLQIPARRRNGHPKPPAALPTTEPAPALPATLTED